MHSDMDIFQVTIKKMVDIQATLKIWSQLLLKVLEL